MFSFERPLYQSDNTTASNQDEFIEASLALELSNLSSEPKRNLSEDDILEIVRLYTEEQLSLRQIAQRYDRSWVKVRDLLLKRGVKLRRRGLPLGKYRWENKDRRVEIPIDEALYLHQQEGWSFKKLADKYSCSWQTIRKKLFEAGLPKQNSGKYIHLPENEIIQSYQNGETVEAIARLYGVSPMTIRRRLAYIISRRNNF